MGWDPTNSSGLRRVDLHCPGTLILFVLFVCFYVETLLSLWTTETVCLIYFLIIQPFVLGRVGVIDLITSHTCLIRVPCLWEPASNGWAPSYHGGFPKCTKCPKFYQMLLLFGNALSTPISFSPFSSPAFLVPVGPNEAIQVFPPSLAALPTHPMSVWCTSCVLPWHPIQNWDLGHSHAVLHLLP